MTGDAIKVTVRFRPMNRREKAEEMNSTCVKISECRTALQIKHPERPERPLNFYFDQIYPPGVTQADVYEFTGAPLMKALKGGFNSTIFAYGQTGSGKTFSMMGVLGTEMKGIQPRLIEDTFDYIENMPADCEDDFRVQISMCEIYMERVKDLFNPINDNLKIRESQDKGIYIDGVVEQYCASVQEVLDSMDTGFMNRATSATKMNPESSRSHCVTILKITRTKPNGSKSVSKIKMVDLAGSEKTSKTEATGQRLKEAMMINSSLTALSKVLNALTGAGDGFVPYRDSKLTRLLQDALGGNSKTSLIVAASPCAFNVDETLSSLRFGTRAKKVKCKTFKIETLSPNEYKKRVARLEKEVEALTLENQLLKLREEAVSDWLKNKGYDYNDIVKDVKIPSDEPESMEGREFAFQEVSDKLCEIDKKSGRAVGGSLFTASMGGAKKANLRKKMEEEKAENARIAGLVATLIAKGDYEGAGKLMQGKVQMGGGVSSEAAAAYEDELADLKAEIRGCDTLNDNLQDELDVVQDRMDEMAHEVEAIKARLAEHRFYKQKVNFLEKENEMAVKQLKDQSFVSMSNEDDEGELDEEFLASVPANLRPQVAKMAKALNKKNALLKRLQGEKSIGLEDILEQLQGSNKAGAVKKILEMQMNTKTELMEKTKEAAKAKTVVSMLQKRQGHYQELQSNWKNQLQQMENAVLLCSQIHKRDRSKFMTELKGKDEEIMKLKAYVQNINKMRKKGKLVLAPSSIGNIRSKKMIRKTRPKRRQHSRSASIEISEAGASEAGSVHA